MGYHHVQKWVWKCSCKGQGQAGDLVGDPRPLGSLTGLAWASTGRRSSRPGQVHQHFHQHSSYYFAAGGLRSGKEQIA